MPFSMPQDKTPDEMPLYVREIFTVAEEFRGAAEGELGETWRTLLPRVPLTKIEVKHLLKTRMEVDELRTLRRLAALGSQSAGILTRLEITREMVQEVLRRLRADRAAQVTLATVLAGTRFRVIGATGLVPAGCGKCHVMEDSFDHLLACYKLEDLYATGERAVEFLTVLAKRVKLTPPGVSRPHARYR